MRRAFFLLCIAAICCLVMHHPEALQAQNVTAKLGNASGATFTVADSAANAMFVLTADSTSPNAVIGYKGNTVTSGVYGAAIGGGGYSSHVNSVRDDFGTIGGGAANAVGDGSGTTSDMPYGTVGGGYGNTASGMYATIGGGANNAAGGEDATVGGGTTNTAGGDHATIGGGYTNKANADYATIGGGTTNTASLNYDTVAGGATNTASGGFATVGGGVSNSATGAADTVGGGSDNTASGTYSTVPGGYGNTAGKSYSFAAGARANAAHNNSFVWNDRDGALGASTAVNQVRFYFGGSGSTCYVDADHTNWTCSSDRALKDNFKEVDSAAILKSLVAMPVLKYTMKSGDPTIRHVGPVSQDFHAAFSLGGDDKTIGTADAIGVSMAAIQGLYKAVQEKNAEISELRAEIKSLKARHTATLAHQAAKMHLLETAIHKLNERAGITMDARAARNDP